MTQFYRDLNPERLRIRRPSKFIFLCGGVIQPQATRSTKASSLRDYLVRIFKFEKKLHGSILLAERATQIYRDTDYRDLISFEEDIARIASIVLVITESPGSLAELGAFASNPTIRKALRIISQSQFADAESFVRFGPIERMKRDDESYVGFFPWKTNSRNYVVKTTIKPHYATILKFINDHIDAIAKSVTYPESDDIRVFYVIYWIIYISVAVSKSTIYDIIKQLFPTMTNTAIRNKMYCMQLSGWISLEDYSGKEYFFVLHDIDPFDYSFNEGVTDRDSDRRKFAVAEAAKSTEKIPAHVLRTAIQRRRPA